MNSPLKIIRQTPQWIALHKPAGYVVYRDSPDIKAPGCKELLELHLNRVIYPVHRIDKDTCGILLFAFDRKTAADLTQLFQMKKIQKRYLAVVEGKCPEHFVCKEPLPKNKSSETESARTDVHLVAHSVLHEKNYSIVMAEPKTGRFHQIRRHLVKRGHPIVGDPLYGNRTCDGPFIKNEKRPPMLLCAIELEWLDEKTKKKVSLKTQPDFQDILLKIKKASRERGETSHERPFAKKTGESS